MGKEKIWTNNRGKSSFNEKLRRGKKNAHKYYKEVEKFE
jgi:hypothetical protein